jgi:hypothetical protein
MAGSRSASLPGQARGRHDQLALWTLIDGMPTAYQFAEKLLQAPPGFTSRSEAIDLARHMLAVYGHVADSQVIEVSGDGINNDRRPITEARHSDRWSAHPAQ